MATSRSDVINFCFLAFCASLILIPTSCSNKKQYHVALFIFGDSLYDSGNNKYIGTGSFSNVWPYGETFFKHPTGRACDGRLIPDFIAEYANLPLIPPYLQFKDHKFISKENIRLEGAGVLVESLQEMVIDLETPQKFLEYSGYHPFKNGLNFASGGAGALSETHQGMVIDLKTQLGYFADVEKQLRQELGDAEAKKLLSDAVYVFSIGGNDYFAATAEDKTLLQRYSREEYVGMVIGNLTTVIQEIHEKGGRKFGFSTLIPLGCLPFMRALKEANTGESGCMEEATILAELHNTALSKALEELEGRLEGFKYSKFDAYRAGIARINNPLKHGFKEVKEGCCGSGPYKAAFACGQIGRYQLCNNVNEYFFFDGAHPTDSANYQFAELMWRGSPDIVSPHNLRTLFKE